MTECRFDECWVGTCNAEVVDGEDFCEKHLGQKCWCGEQATRNCSIACSFVCGAPLCDEHECKCIAGGLTGSHGNKHSEKGYRQWEEWKEKPCQ